MDYITIANSNGCHNKCMIVIFGRGTFFVVIVTYAIPWIFLDVHVGLFNVPVFGEKVSGEG